MSVITIRGKTFETDAHRGIRVEIAEVDLGNLSDGSLGVLEMAFRSNARKCRRAIFSVARNIHYAVERVHLLLLGEMIRRALSEPSPAEPLVLVLRTIEDAGLLAAFLTGIEQTYIGVRSRMLPQSEKEKDIFNKRSSAWECAEFCAAVAAAICETEIEVS